jgi:hypothetical protein
MPITKASQFTAPAHPAKEMIIIRLITSNALLITAIVRDKTPRLTGNFNVISLTNYLFSLFYDLVHKQISNQNTAQRQQH